MEEKANGIEKVLEAGMGIAALSSVLGAEAFANIDKKGRHALVITCGGSPPNRAAFGLLMGQTVADREWGKVTVWTILDSTDLVNKNKTEETKFSIYKKFGNARES